VRASLEATGTALVRDHELRAGVDVLFDMAAPTLSPRHEGMRTELVHTQGLTAELFFAPHRNIGAAPQPAHDAASCPFCSPAGPALSWRGRRVLPNAFPYAPSSSQHLLLLPIDHKPQVFDRAFFTDALDLQRWLGADVALHFNGMAGNSQPHLHFHAHRERLPLERAIDDGRAERSTMGVVDGAQVERVAHGPLRGLLVSGSDAAITAAAEKLCRTLDDDAAVAGRYNMHLLRRGQTARLVIVARRADTLALQTPTGTSVGAGAFDVAGRRVVEADHIDPVVLSTWQDLLPRTVVDPRDVAGLGALLAAAPTVLRGVQLRAWVA
jgi:hypothetical protein